MARPRPVAAWMGAAFVAGACLAATALAIFGAGERGTDIALQVTARFSFLLFLAAYAGAPLSTFFGARFHSLRAAGRRYGLAFASAQTVHALLVVWLCWIGFTPPAGVFAVFGPALFSTYCLAVFSFGDLSKVAGGWPWWLVRRIGMNLIAAVFTLDFLRHPLSGGMKHVIEYVPFAALSLLAVALYAAALAKTALLTPSALESRAPG